MQQADYHHHRPTPWMQESVHAQKSYPPQAVAHESSKVGRRGKREEERQEREKPGGWWKERQPNKTKHIGRTKIRPAYLGTGWGEQRRGGAPNFPSQQKVTPCPLHHAQMFPLHQLGRTLCRINSMPFN